MKSASTSQGYHLGVTDPVNLLDPVWTTLHIALFLGQQPDSVLSIVNSVGFPTPLANQKRNRRWLANDVKSFFERRSKGEYPTIPKTSADKSHTPKSIRLKHRTGS
jgi:hypothetical protein